MLTYFAGSSNLFLFFFLAVVLRVKETKVSKHTVGTHQLSRITAFPCSDGELQQVNVQHTHVVCVTQTRGGFIRKLLILQSFQHILLFILLTITAGQALNWQTIFQNACFWKKYILSDLSICHSASQYYSGCSCSFQHKDDLLGPVPAIFLFSILGLYWSIINSSKS